VVGDGSAFGLTIAERRVRVRLELIKSKSVSSVEMLRVSMYIA
jgi:hypothetical protein